MYAMRSQTHYSGSIGNAKKYHKEAIKPSKCAQFSVWAHLGSNIKLMFFHIMHFCLAIITTQ